MNLPTYFKGTSGWKVSEYKGHFLCHTFHGGVTVKPNGTSPFLKGELGQPDYHWVLGDQAWCDWVDAGCPDSHILKEYPAYKAVIWKRGEMADRIGMSITRELAPPMPGQIGQVPNEPRPISMEEIRKI